LQCTEKNRRRRTASASLRYSCFRQLVGELIRRWNFRAASRMLSRPASSVTRRGMPGEPPTLGAEEGQGVQGGLVVVRGVMPGGSDELARGCRGLAGGIHRPMDLLRTRAETNHQRAAACGGFKDNPGRVGRRLEPRRGQGGGSGEGVLPPPKAPRPSGRLAPAARPARVVGSCGYVLGPAHLPEPPSGCRRACSLPGERDHRLTSCTHLAALVEDASAGEEGALAAAVDARLGPQ
jgi:hypothetical protein